MCNLVTSNEANTETTVDFGLCKHKYCIPCIKEWIKEKNRCPQCKELIVGLNWKDPITKQTEEVVILPC